MSARLVHQHKAMRPGVRRLGRVQPGTGSLRYRPVITKAIQVARAGQMAPMIHADKWPPSRNPRRGSLAATRHSRSAPSARPAPCPGSRFQTARLPDAPARFPSGGQRFANALVSTRALSAISRSAAISSSRASSGPNHCACPGIRRNAKGLPRASIKAWIFVLNPPRLWPIA